MGRYCLVFLLLLIVVSCADSQDIKFNKEVIEITSDTLLYKYSTSSKIIIRDSKILILRNDALNKRLEIYDLNDRRLKKIINYDVTLGSADDFNISNKGNLVLSFDEINRFAEINWEGETISTMDLNIKDDKKGTAFVSYSNNRQPFEILKKYFIFCITANTGFADYFEYPLIAVYNTEEEKVDKIVNFPESMRNGYNYYDFYPSYCINSEQNLLVSFGSDSHLFEYNLNGTLINKHFAESEYIDKFRKISSEELNDKKRTIDYQVTRANFQNIFYDKVNNLYYRIAIHAQESVDEDGMMNQFEDNPWSIIILDDNYNTLKEIAMAAKKYNYTQIFQFDNQIYIQINQNNNMEMSSLKYEVITISKGEQ